MDPRVNGRQQEVLRWIADGCPLGRWEPDDVSYKLSSIALQNRKLVKLGGRGPNWSADVTDAGSYFLAHGEYPVGHPLRPVVASSTNTAKDDARKDVDEPAKPPTEPVQLSPPPTPRSRRTAKSQRMLPAPVVDIDSPRRHRERLSKQETDLDPNHPWDDRILISVREAAWLLSLSEGMIRQAVRDGDLERVFIGQGTTHYRIVHNSLLAWVSAMPRQSPRYHW